MTVLSPHRYDNARPGGAAFLEIPDPKGTPSPAPLKETVLSGEVRGPLASLTLSQTFDCSFLPEGTAAEALYRFPLPGDAMVRGIVVRFGETTIRTTLAERKEAEKTYEEAKKEGKRGALVTRESEDAVTLRVTGITSGEQVLVETGFLLWLSPLDDGFSLRVPLTIAPRYVRKDEERNPRKNAQPLDIRWDPGHRARLSLRCVGFRSVECESNAIRTAERSDPEDNSTEILVSFGDEDSGGDAGVFPDQDLVLRLRPVAESSPRLDVLAAPDGAFLALVTPPAEPPANLPPREILLLMDHSGSMTGAKWEASDWAVRSFLSKLGEDDLVNVGFFHDVCSWMVSAPVKATDETRAKALRFIENALDSGGTNLGAALEEALLQPRTPGEFARHVVVVTDGQVGDYGRISTLLERERERKSARRTNVVCIDSAPNEPLSRMIAERGRGVCRFLSSSPDEVDIATALDDVFDEFSRPLALGVRLRCDVSLRDAQGLRSIGEPPAEGEDEAKGAPGKIGSLDLGDLSSGRARWICGYAAGPAGRFELADKNGETIASAEPRIPSERFADAVSALAGALRVRRLEAICEEMEHGEAEDVERSLRMTGLSPEKTDSSGIFRREKRALYLENREREARKEIGKLILEEALRMGVLCSKTSFVAVHEKAGSVVSRSLVVANALPRGWDAGFAASARAMSMQGASLTGGFFVPSNAPRMSMRIASMLGSSAPEDMDCFSVCGNSAPPAEEMPISRSMPRLRRAARSGKSASPEGTDLGIEVFNGPLPREEGLLFEGSAGAGVLQGVSLLTRLVLKTGGKDAEKRLEGSLLRLLINGAPIASVALADMLAFGGERPLNVRLREGDRLEVRISGYQADEDVRISLFLRTT